MKGIHYPNMKSPTPMFKYEPRENQFYMHYRKGFGEGWIPITYCIYCGEPLSEMVEKYGIPKVIADRLDPSEWQGKYKLCTKKKVLTTNFQKRLLLFFLTQVENDIIVLCHRFMGHNHKDNSHNLSCMELIGISPPT
ncbi:MAG: hypothetical protein LBJ75_02180 [Puniceicoccales bacterium]|nr:hypothetical protein [Puniceicoccales bacterium]